MDSIGLRELIRTGRDLAVERLVDSAENGEPAAELHPGVVNVVDRLALAGFLFLEHQVDLELWEYLVESLRDIYRAGLPPTQHYVSTSPARARVYVAVIQRVLALGAFAVRKQAYQYAAKLTLQLPENARENYYWIRHGVTMAARSELQGAFQAKSLIGPASELVRDHPEFFRFFDASMDDVVSLMCQYDFFSCVLTVYTTRNLDRCYPNFGAYWNRRSLPVVSDMVRGGPSRAALGEMPDEVLAEILVKLDDLAATNYFEVNGWHRNGWERPEIVEFIAAHYKPDPQ